VSKAFLTNRLHQFAQIKEKPSNLKRILMSNCFKSYVPLRTSIQVLRFLQCFALRFMQHFGSNVLRMKYVSNYLSIHKLLKLMKLIL